MSAQEIRNVIIAENVPELIKSLISSTIGESNIDASAEAALFQTCENFAWTQIRRDLFAYVSSHSVRRNIDKIAERFTIENMPEFAEYFKQLCAVLVEHASCTEHYEVDIQWSVIDFLLAIAQNPMTTTRRQRAYKNVLREETLESLFAPDESIGQREEQKVDDWLQELHQDFIQPHKIAQTDDELSDWSSDDTEPTTVAETQVITFIPPKLPKRTPLRLKNIQPPTAQSQFTVYKPNKTLANHVHSRWWHTDTFTYTAIESTSFYANFAIAHVQQLNNLSNNLFHFKPPSTTTEHCLLREIIMMFFAPVDCRYFMLHDNVIKLHKDVTISSVNVVTLQDYIRNEILGPMQMMYELNQYIRGYESCINQTRTTAAFGAALRKLLQPVKDALIAYEQRLIQADNVIINTLMTFQKHMRKPFKTLYMLHNIAKRAQELPIEAPAHVKSMFLLALLFELSASGCGDNPTYAALLMYTFKIYANMLDSWWRIGCLHDWQQEFIVEYDQENIMHMRDFNTDAKVPTHVVAIIERSPLYKLLKKHSLESGDTQSLLYELEHINNLFASCRDVTEQKLHNKLIDEIFAYLRRFRSESEANADVETSPAHNVAVNESRMLENFHVFNQLTTTQDEHLLGAFHANIVYDSDIPSANLDLSICDLLTRLKIPKRMPPLQKVFMNTLHQVLGKRNELVNVYAMRFYRSAVRIHAHVQHIRNVLLLQANFAMYTFYAPLFEKIESHEHWANSAVLSMKLDDIVSEHFPDMSALICIELQSVVRLRTDKVYLAATEIGMSYELNPALARIISHQNICDYNKVFQLLLCVKWAVWKLERLRFPKKPPQAVYSPLKFIDFLMRRLEQLRFWIIYVINSLHFHLCTNVLMAMGKQFEQALDDCQNLYELKQLHQSYLSTICTRCFVTQEFADFRFALDQLFNLIYVLNLEWNSCVDFIEKSHALSSNDSDESQPELSYPNANEVDHLELTYIRCHQLLARIITEAVNVHGHAFLSGLELCISNSVPY